jgi:hypothetical protein
LRYLFCTCGGGCFDRQFAFGGVIDEFRIHTYPKVPPPSLTHCSLPPPPPQIEPDVRLDLFLSLTFPSAISTSNESMFLYYNFDEVEASQVVPPPLALLSP